MAEKILIVDDEPDMLVLLRRVIRENTPYKTELASNPLEAIELAKEYNDFDLVITDQEMPVLDGIGLLRAIRRHNAEIPAIVMDIPGREEEINKAAQTGCFDVIMKPFRKEHLLTAIEEALKSNNSRLAPSLSQ